MYRLAVFPIFVPPLRMRDNDRELLAKHFLDELNQEAGTSKRFSRQTMDQLGRHRWPGNVRELKNLVHRAFILSADILTLEIPPVGDKKYPRWSMACLISRLVPHWRMRRKKSFWRHCITIGATSA